MSSEYISKLLGITPVAEVQTLKILVSVSATMQEWVGAEGLQLRPMDGRAAIMFDKSPAELTSAQICDVRILHSVNTFPVAAGCNMSFLRNRENAIYDGTRFNHILMPESNVPVPESISPMDAASEKDKQALEEWVLRYPTFTHDNIDTQGVMPFAGYPFVFVHQHHPAMQMIEHNADKLGLTNLQDAKFDTEWFKISVDLFHACVKTIRKDVLKKMLKTDLNNMVFEFIPITDEGVVMFDHEVSKNNKTLNPKP
jgi:hypothetical protein